MRKITLIKKNNVSTISKLYGVVEGKLMIFEDLEINHGEGCLMVSTGGESFITSIPNECIPENELSTASVVKFAFVISNDYFEKLNKGEHTKPAFCEAG